LHFGAETLVSAPGEILMTTSDPANPNSLRALAEQSNAWPFEQAKAIVARLKKEPKDEVLFETGYGPSGLPHIGTFGEVARTTMVRHAFRVLTEDKIKTRLIAFSDDMDGLRKVPDNVPNKEMLTAHLGKPLTRVPDPFGTYPSFGEHNNARLRSFLDAFGFDYEFASATDYYTSGRFDATLLRMLARIDQVMSIMLPSLREERAASYSPFLPISPSTGQVLYVPVVEHNARAGTVSYDDPETRERVTLPVTGGHCKLQWKPDWAMRWVALGVDYEMAGKDLIDSVKLSARICSALGGTPPEGFNYELFLDEQGRKISKSKGNGLTIDEWLRYASPESLSLFMYREPKAAKRLYFDVIPRNVDDYQQFLEAFRRQDPKQQLANPVWHIHAGRPPPADMPVTFQLLLTLVSSSNAENAETLWGFIRRYRPDVTPATHPKLDAMVRYAINYYRDFVAPSKKFREPTLAERAALQDLRDALAQLPAEASAEEIQNVVYEVGRREPFLDAVKKGKDGRPGVSLEWFNMLYQVLLGLEKGPRFGSFVAAYGPPNAVAMIDGALVRSEEDPDDDIFDGLNPTNVPDQKPSPIYAKIEGQKIVLDSGRTLQPLLSLNSIERTRHYLKEELIQLVDALQSSNVDRRLTFEVSKLSNLVEFEDDAGAIVLGLHTRKVGSMALQIEQEISSVLTVQVSSTLTQISHFASQYKEWIDFLRNAAQYPAKEAVEGSIDRSVEKFVDVLAANPANVDTRIPATVRLIENALSQRNETRAGAIYAAIRGFENVCIVAVKFAFDQVLSLLKETGGKLRDYTAKTVAATIIVLTLGMIGSFMPVIRAAPELNWILENLPKIEKLKDLLK
jgi:lysyl-tRNA synthetase, class I